jgi:hypothetical protein
MPTYVRSSGIRLTVPDVFVSSDRETPPAPRLRDGTGSGAIPIPLSRDSEAQALAEAFAAQELQLIDEVEIKPAPEQPAATRAALPPSAAPRTASLEVTVAGSENVVVLVERDGEYSWVRPSGTPVINPPARRGLVLDPGSKTVTVQVMLEGEPRLDSAARQRGWLGDLVLDRVKAWVFKFVAVVAIGQMMKFLERNVSRGLVVMEGEDPAMWKPTGNNVIPGLPQDRPARILLFIHGTFSSTAGGFGVLCGTPWGQELLAAIRHNYDAVIGFDHATLSESPLANASELLNILERQAWPFPPIIDAVAHSRGGLVLRSLTEFLIPAASFHPVMDRAVFVGCTNAGTQLANPEHWAEFVDCYTNAAVAACRLLQTIPQATAVAAVLKELVQGVGALVKYLASAAADEDTVPGLAAMSPGSEFLTRLNGTQPGQPTPATTHYYVVTSDFRPELKDQNVEPPELPRRLALAIADGLADRIIGEANDLVVNIASMPAIDGGGFVKDTFAFGRTSKVYHTTYFHRPEVANALARWLQLAPPPVTAMPPLARAMAPGLEVPANIDTDVVVATADAALDQLQQAILDTSPAYVVLERPWQGQTLRYVLDPHELMDAPAAPGKQVAHALDLHEWDSVPARTLRGSAIPSSVGRTTGTRVVVDQGRIVGVAAERAFFDKPLAGLAKITAGASNDVAEQALRRRAMPTFAAPTPLNQQIPTASEVAWQHYYFNASMEEEVILKRTATIEVDISTEVLAMVAGMTNAPGEGVVDTSKKLIVQVMARAQFEVRGEDRAEVDPPAPGIRLQLFFDVVGTNEGDGEVWVVVRQGQISIATLVLKARVVMQRSTTIERTAARAQTVDAPTVDPMVMLRISQRTNGNESRYDYELQAMNLNIIAERATSDPLHDQIGFIGDIYRTIEGYWATSSRNAQAFATKLKAYGASLARQLLPEGLRRTMWKNRKSLQKIVVLSNEPFIPWELLLLDNPDRSDDPEAFFLGEMGLVRWIYDVDWAPAQIDVRPARAFFVVPDYPVQAMKLPQAKNEGAWLQSMFSAHEIPADSASVQQQLATPGTIDLLHFAGHGMAQFGTGKLARILLAGTMAGGQYVYDYLDDATVQFAGKLTAPDGNRPLVVLNACQVGSVCQQLSSLGGFAEAFLHAGAGAFVSCLWSVGDQPACEFTQELYTQLKKGTALAEAVIAARRKAKNGDATWLAYSVYGNPFCKVAYQT